MADAKNPANEAKEAKAVKESKDVKEKADRVAQETKKFLDNYQCPVCLSCEVSQVYLTSCKHNLCGDCLCNMMKDNKVVQIADFSIHMVTLQGECYPEIKCSAFPTKLGCPSCRSEFQPFQLIKFWKPRALPTFDVKFFRDNGIGWRNYCQWCETKLLYNESASHILSCPKLITRCEDCKQSIQLRKHGDSDINIKEAFLEHYKEHCTMMVSCPWCHKENKENKVQCRHMANHLARHENVQRICTDLESWTKTIKNGVNVDCVTLLSQVEKYSQFRHVPLCKKRGKMTITEKIQERAQGLSLHLMKNSWKTMKKVTGVIKRLTIKGGRGVAKYLNCEDLLPRNQEEEDERIIRERMLGE
jgi:hypothetical protein